jgi:AcrR family transcriptional regulator
LATSDQGELRRPRKRPVQARSEATVSALFEASIQVLLAAGYRKLTTTRVAERAGVSVGTLYQYFPNREALIICVIEQYLEEIVSSIEQTCQELNGQPLEELATGLVDAFIAVKYRRVELSRALREPLADVGGAQLVKAAAQRAAGALADSVQNCPDASFRDKQLPALLIVMACSSLMQIAVIDQTVPLETTTLRAHMRALVLGYLREAQQLEPARWAGRSD